MDMTTPDLQQLVKRLNEATTLLASNASEQEAWARGNNVPIEEMRLNFLDLVPDVSSHLLKHGLIDDSTESILLEIEHRLNGMTGMERRELWTDWNAVAEAEEWKCIRQLAALATEKLHASPV